MTQTLFPIKPVNLVSCLSPLDQLLEGIVTTRSYLVGFDKDIVGCCTT